jgi:hypothetical protein
MDDTLEQAAPVPLQVHLVATPVFAVSLVTRPG